MDRSIRLWWWSLVVLTAATLLFSLAMVALPAPTQRLFGGLYLSAPGGISAFGAGAAHYIGFVTAVLGAVMAGWAAAMLVVLLGPFRAGRPDAWWLIAIPLVVWFIPDTAYSLWSGFWQNVALNIVVLVLFAIPLVASYSGFRRPRT